MIGHSNGCVAWHREQLGIKTPEEKRIEELSNQLLEKIEELAECKRDAERLDFITDSAWSVQWEYKYNKPKRYRMIDDGDVWGKWYSTAREAIDAAMGDKK